MTLNDRHHPPLPGANRPCFRQTSNVDKNCFFKGEISLSHVQNCQNL